jgi:hypothetical protein
MDRIKFSLSKTPPKQVCTQMEHELPASITSRVAKAALPDKAILTKDARNTLNTAASMFALYLGTA